MTRAQRRGIGCALVVAGLLLVPVAADAQITRVTRVEPRQAIGLNLGYFAVRGEDARVADDVLLENLNAHLFDVSDFNGATVGGEWLFGVGQYLEAGAGIGFYRRTVPSIYRDVTFPDRSEIEQDFRLRVVPMTATVRFLPAGRGGGLEPYVGAGIGLLNWRYSEVGEFVDFSDGTIFRSRFVANGNTVGPVLLAGLRAPVGHVWAVGGELRYQRGEGDLTADQGFLADRIDLGGWSVNLTMHLRF